MIVITSWVAIALFALAGLASLKVESDVTLWFPRGTEVRDSYEAIRDRLSGISPINIIVESRTGELVSSPDVIQALDELGRELASLETVGKTYSLGDLLRQLNEQFVGEQSVGLPVARDEIEQALLLLGSAVQLNDVLSPDHLATNILVRANANGSRALLDIASFAESWWDKYGPPGFAARPSGIMLQFARAQDGHAR